MSIGAFGAERTPSIGRQLYLSGGNASARATNLTRVASRSARNAAFTAAADSFAAASCARAGAGSATSARAVEITTCAKNRRAGNAGGNMGNRSLVDVI